MLFAGSEALSPAEGRVQAPSRARPNGLRFPASTSKCRWMDANGWPVS
jgi:hypothetical protein